MTAAIVIWLLAGFPVLAFLATAGRGGIDPRLGIYSVLPTYSPVDEAEQLLRGAR
jgi:hypothetical protein